MDFLEFLGFGHDNYRKHAPFFGRKSTVFAQTFGFLQKNKNKRIAI